MRERCHPIMACRVRIGPISIVIDEPDFLIPDMRRTDALAGAIERTPAALLNIGGLLRQAGIVDTGTLEGITPQS